LDRKIILLADGGGLAGEWRRAFSCGEPWVLLTATTGVEAYEAAALERPDLIVMSVLLPELNGVECCRRLKAHPELQNIPVVLVAHEAGCEELERCRLAGCDDLLLGAIDQQRFADLCRKHLQGDRRVALRVPVQMTVRYGVGADQRKLSDYSLNLSTGGLFIETQHPPPINTPLTLEFNLPGRHISVRCRGRVAWLNLPGRKLQPALPAGMGVQFLDLSLEDMRLVRIFIKQELERQS
jgi:uncharacterized protein (TIGR02266 family)